MGRYPSRVSTSVPAGKQSGENHARPTGLPAQTFGLKDRGVLKEGAYADIAIFDPATVNESGTWEDPIRAAHGIEATIVNGQPVWRAGKPTGARSGRVLGRG